MTGYDGPPTNIVDGNSDGHFVMQVEEPEAHQMTVEEASKAKYEIEQEIRALLNKFKDDSGVMLTGIQTEIYEFRDGRGRVAECEVLDVEIGIGI